MKTKASVIREAKYTTNTIVLFELTITDYEDGDPIRLALEEKIKGLNIILNTLNWVLEIGALPEA